ncbi:P-loop NTPase fold protein [Paenibacillus solani]|uniref:KAP NTPase domain-containing protein n=1 Tax=Paenibacillus solani TaxID=1705565 RepID=A0A0M1P7U4_9BACL|nr:P-loop NTPase fold protein [Paenibacillus solani]KOR90563.1 hypothetical protein AM231_16470 [Paenibacillus solani]
MNYTKVITTIEKIYDNNFNDNLCVLIDGEWGIGKTYTIKKWSEDRKEKYDFKYVSVFGKLSIKEVEKDLILQLYEVFNSLQKITDSNMMKIGSNVAKKMAKKFTGIDFNLSDLIENISIENISNENSNKKIILCIDDIERKSKSIAIKDLLGLIERASNNFNVILIANSLKLNDDLKDFSDYKEKIIDYEFKINELDPDILDEIALNKIPYLTKAQLESLVQSYINEGSILINFNNNSVTKKETQLEKSNIRIYKKFVDLIKLVNEEAIDLLNKKDIFSLDENVVTLCKNVVYHYYFSSEKEFREASGANFDKLSLFKEIQKIFKYEDYSKDILRDYFLNDTEISRDIKVLYKAYKLNMPDFTALCDKISNNISNDNLLYFVGQKQIISLADVLHDLGMLREFKEKLLEIADRLYNPELQKQPPYFDSEDWCNIDYFGMEPCSRETLEIISSINKINVEKHRTLLKQKYDEALNQKDIRTLGERIKNIYIEKLSTFETLFEIAFEKLKVQFNVDTWEFIHLLIGRTNSDLIKDFFREREKRENDLILKKRYQQLNEVLAERMYFERETERCQESIDD